MHDVDLMIILLPLKLQFPSSHFTSHLDSGSSFFLEPIDITSQSFTMSELKPPEQKDKSSDGMFNRSGYNVDGRDIGAKSETAPRDYFDNEWNRNGEEDEQEDAFEPLKDAEEYVVKRKHPDLYI
jgi:hypothetical protein